MVKIDSMKFGEIRVDGKTYYSDLTIWWDGHVEMRDKSHTFGADEFLGIASKKPEVIVVGTGTDGVLRIEEEVGQLASRKGIKIYDEISPKAVDLFNAFLAEGKRVVGVIHATC